MNKKILLLVPPYSTKDRYGKQLEKVSPMSLPLLSLAYIGSVLEKEGHQVEILDAAIEKMTREEVIQFILKEKPDILGTTVFTPSYFRVQEIVQDERIKDITIIVGGPHATVLPKEVLEENSYIDFVVVGEGEETIVELMKSIEYGKGFENIKGIAYRDGDEIRINERRPLIKDLDTIPLPARHLLPLKKYVPAPSSYKKLPVMHLISTRGCPYNCIYCSSRSIFGKKYRVHSVERVIKEIKICIEEYGAKEIYFLDDNFTMNRQWVIQLCDEIIKLGLHKKFIWNCNTRVNLVDEELLKKMKEAGCYFINFGIESGSQRLLDIIKKDITLEQSRQAMVLCKKIKISTRNYAIIGIPTETREESEQTIRFLKELNSTHIKVSLLTPYPGTPVFEQIKNELKVKDWAAWKTMGGFIGNQERPYCPSGRTSIELNELQRRAHREFYMRPKKILQLLLSVRSIEEMRVMIKSFLALRGMK